MLPSFRLKIMLRVGWLVLLLQIGWTSVRAQHFIREHLFLSPSITIGYTFGARVSYGGMLDMGYYAKARDNSVYRMGVSLSHYFVEAKHHTGRLTAASLMLQKNFTDIKVGVGRAVNKWGYQNRNVTKVYGFHYDLSMAIPSKTYNTWLGIRHFIYKPADWPFFEAPYTSVYLKYKYEVIQPYSRQINGTALHS